MTERQSERDRVGELGGWGEGVEQGRVGGGGQVCAISAGTVCAVPERGDMAVAGINKQSAAPEHHDQTAAQLKSFPGTLGERSWSLLLNGTDREMIEGSVEA